MRRKLPGPELTEADVEAALADVDDASRAAWERSVDAQRQHWLRTVREYGGEPPELTELLADDEHARAWAEVPLFLQLEWHCQINRAWSKRQRAGLAHMALHDPLPPQA